MLLHLLALGGFAGSIGQNDGAAHAHASHDHVATIKVINEFGFGARLCGGVGAVAARRVTHIQQQRTARIWRAYPSSPTMGEFPHVTSASAAATIVDWGPAETERTLHPLSSWMGLGYVFASPVLARMPHM